MMASRPVAFFCHASEADDFARPIATALMDAGINTFFDEWSIGMGDSIRQRIDQGLLDCTHFVVLLTEISITKDWVNTEIDAGFRVVGNIATLVGRSLISGRRANGALLIMCAGFRSILIVLAGLVILGASPPKWQDAIREHPQTQLEITKTRKSIDT